MIHKTLADSMRPIGLDDVIGQKHLVGENRLLKQFEQMKTMMKRMKNGNFKMPF